MAYGKNILVDTDAGLGFLEKIAKLSDAGRDLYLRDCDQQADEFAAQFGKTLEEVDPEIITRRFDELADQLVQAAPSNTALTRASRVLGRRYSLILREADKRG